ncbi:MAG: hypothetical protein JSV64_02975 [Candidatus Bathyarchaeota archaeon]|nr:MAG: hypothetical protein JSV64_02975 [Candidatus Bathyarchaeota archaeon]
MIRKSSLISIISAISVGLLIASAQAPSVPKPGWSHGGLRRQGSNTDLLSGSAGIPSSTVSGGL